ncbi:MAG: SsrA-binding protein SmpB [Rickettsiales bacterium]|jgi:SsrA-binding protein|nr:SsrA-binding protein SmpB [Rickettsiales bacterium]
MTIIAQNRKAKFEYEILQEYNAGIVLVGTEIKSLRQGRANIQDGYVDVDKNGEAWLYSVNIPVYNMTTNKFNHEPNRKRKLLLQKKELNKLLGSIKEKGLTIVPLTLYFSNKGFVKIKIALAKGKKLFDKRQTIKERDWKREKEQIMKKNAR